METALGPPNADTARQAIYAIRGYEYQILAAALAWVDVEENGLIYLEVAEDYAHVIGGTIEAVQVKDTSGSRTVTLNSPAVRDAIKAFVDLVERNPGRDVHLRFLTTAKIGREKSPNDRPGNRPGLKYWQQARTVDEDIGPLRALLEREPSPETVREFCRRRTDEQLLADLVRKITWDCGSPDTADLRRDLEERVCVFLGKRFGVPSQDARPFADVLASRVLSWSATPDEQDRALSYPALRQLAESFSSVSLPRTVFEALLSKSLNLPDPLRPGEAKVYAWDLARPPWIVDAATLPKHTTLVRRESLETLVRSALRDAGLCFVVGPTGTGKSILARCVAGTFAGPCFWVDLRDADVSETQKRLKQVFILLAELGPATLMLEDINCLAEPSVQTSLGEVVGGAKRRDMRIIVTSNRRPSATLLNALATDSSSIVKSPHFTLEETHELIRDHNGDPSVWGHVAHLACGGGHPQLTYVFVAGMAARDWPNFEIDRLIVGGLTNADLEDEFRAARNKLRNTLSEPTRELLYRLSLAIAPFERSLGVAVGTVQPSIERAGECFDELADRWLEPTKSDRYRLSPLMRGVAQNMLTTTRQRLVHREFATALTARKTISVSDIDPILHHGLFGASQDVLVELAKAINSADEKTLRYIAKHVVIFPYLDSTRPIYPANLPTSVMLRLMQLKLLIKGEESDDADRVAGALFSEIDAMPNDLDRADFEGAALGVSLNNLGVARHLSDWVSLLSRFRHFANSERATVAMPDPQFPLGAVMFNIGIAGLDCVKRLETIFDDLSRLDDDERTDLLTPINTNSQEYFLLVHYPWTSRARRPDFDAAAAIESYTKMGQQAESWDLASLSIQCHVAVAMILHEQLNDSARAIDVLGNAAGRFGREAVLVRALAKLYQRIGRGSEALDCFRDAVSQMSKFGAVDGVFVVREAAVCAAECGEWEVARQWFLRGASASTTLNAADLGAIDVGLRADAAVASFQVGNLREAIVLMKDAMLGLAKFGADSNLQAAHCHRLVRHAILWLKAMVEGECPQIEGKPITILPGACSNPEPAPAIEQHPLGHIDFGWYMLAEIELVNGFNTGVREVVEKFGAQGHIPYSEHWFRTYVIGAMISEQNAVGFSSYLLKYLQSATYCSVNSTNIRQSFSVLNPERVIFPSLPLNGPYDPATDQFARNAILAYGIRSMLDERAVGLEQLRDALRQELGLSHPGISLFDSWDAGSPGGIDLDNEVAIILGRLVKGAVPSPDLILLAGIRLLTWIAQSDFKPFVLPSLKPWLMARWNRILQKQRFRLRAPATTTPPVLEALGSELEGELFAACLTLAAEAAVGVPFDPGLRQELEKLAGGA